MKKYLFTLLSLLLPFNSSSLSAEEECCSEGEGPFGSHCHNTYFKLGGGLLADGSGMTLSPLIGVGRRYELSTIAIDISAQYASGEKNGSSGTTSFYSLPSMTYLIFVDPHCTSSLYYGGGLSWSGLKNDKHRFNGLFVHLTGGYELHRDSDIRSMVQLDIEQGFFAASKRGTTPGPSLFLSFILGF